MANAANQDPRQQIRTHAKSTLLYNTFGFKLELQTLTNIFATPGSVLLPDTVANVPYVLNIPPGMKNVQYFSIKYYATLNFALANSIGGQPPFLVVYPKHRAYVLNAFYNGNPGTIAVNSEEYTDMVQIPDLSKIELASIIVLPVWEFANFISTAIFSPAANGHSMFCNLTPTIEVYGEPGGL